MISFISFLLFFLITGLVLKAFSANTYRTSGTFKAKNLWRIFITILIAGFLTMVNPIDVERIDAGHVGIKVSNVGDNRGVGKTEYVTGWVFYNSWIGLGIQFANCFRTA